MVSKANNKKYNVVHTNEQLIMDYSVEEVKNPDLPAVQHFAIKTNADNNNNNHQKRQAASSENVCEDNSGALKIK